MNIFHLLASGKTKLSRKIYLIGKKKTLRKRDICISSIFQCETNKEKKIALSNISEEYFYKISYFLIDSADRVQIF